MIKNMEQEKTKVFILSIVFAVLFNIFMYGHMLGINYFLSALAISISTYMIFYKKDGFNKKIYLSGIVIILSLASVYFRLFNPVFRTINYVLVPILFVILMIISIKNIREKLFSKFFVYLMEPVILMDKIFKKFAKLLRGNKSKGSGKHKYIWLGLLITLAVLIIVLPLLMSADEIFKQSLGDIGDYFENWNLGDIFGRVLLFIFIASYSFGYMLNFFKEKKVKLDEVQVVSKSAEEKHQTLQKIVVVASTVVFTLIAVYVAFAFIQVRYLFFNNAQALPGGLSYAEYAREGFFQILAISIINILIVLLTLYSLKKSEVKTRKMSIPMQAIIFLNFIFISSAWYRMYLYESAYGYTRLRLFVYIILAIEAVIMVMLSYKVFKREFNFVKAAMLFTLVAYTMINFVNIDAVIAKKNIDTYFETSKIDINYLEYYLSPDALGQIERLNGHKEISTLGYEYDLEDRELWQEFIIGAHEYEKIIENLK